MSFQKFLRDIDRRSFIKIASLTGVAGLISPRDLLASVTRDELTPVAIVEDENATNGTTIDADVVQIMVNSGLYSLAGQNNIGEAWKTLLPGVTESSIIAIKINCRYSTMPTHPEVTYAVTDGLTQMSFDSVPFPENNIILYDRGDSEISSCGYPINTSSSGIRCFGTTHSGVGYSSETYNVNGRTQRLSTIVTEMADYLINISVLKNHASVAGVTLCLKNHFGTCDSPNPMHGGFGDPYIPALNALAPIAGKQCVNIIDALYGIYTGGPQGNPQFVANKIIMSQDIVAADYWGRELLSDNGCTTINMATHIDSAASSPYNLGTNDPTEMDVANIVNPSSVVSVPDDQVPSNPLLQQNHPNPFNGHTDIRFYVASDTHVSLEIYDIKGRFVRSLVRKSLTPGWHSTSWDGIGSSGRVVASGTYVAQLRAGDFSKSVLMQYVK